MLLPLLLAATLQGPPPPPDYAAGSRAEARVIALEQTLDAWGRDALWIGSSSAADLFSTAWALNRCPSCAEGNPLGFSSEARISLKAGMAVATLSITYKLRRDGHHRSATILRWIVTAVNLTLVANNTIHAIRQE